MKDDEKATPKRAVLADGFIVSPAQNGGWSVHSAPQDLGFPSFYLAAVTNDADLMSYITGNISIKSNNK